MAKGYDLTVQINLRGPANLNNVANNINKKLSNIQANVKVKVPPNVARQLNALNKNMKGIQKSANTASSSMEKFGKSAGLAIRRFGAFTAATAGFYAITRATTQALEKFIEFDRQITRIAQVTGSTRQALSGLGDEITNLSTSLGVSSQELAQVSVVLSQAGLSAQATERALKALALTTLAPTFNDINQTVEGSIALMKQFSISTNQLEGALGSINAVAGQFAVEANDIITAIQRTGGVFAAASNGVSQGTDALNEFIAVFTSVRATTRESAETIATGLRTIFTRIQREDTLDALKAFGIELTDLEGKFVGPFRAIERLSAGLRTLDPRDVKFSSLVEELGGFRQVGKVIPLIQQFATAQNALNVAQQGSGSLARDAAIGQQSLGVQIAKVGEEFNALIRSIGQTGEFKQFISLSLDLASALIKIADAVKPVIPALAALGTIAVGKNIGTFAKGFKGGIGFNQGGMVRGQKGVDKIQTRLTDGEYVIQQPAVKSIGANVLEHINKTGELPGFRKGGPVQAADLASSLVRRRVTRTGKPSEYKSGQRINATDNIQFEVIEQAISSNKNIGNKAFEKKTAQQLGGTTSTSGIAAVDVMVGSGKNAMPVEARNRKSFTSDAELADKLIRQRYAELGDAAFTNRSDPDTISLGAITVAYNAGKLSAAKQKTLSNRGGNVQQRQVKRNKGGYGDPNEFEALVTDGEFIIQESAARSLGPQKLKELNNAHKKGLPKFHTGGMVRRFNKGSPGVVTGSSGGSGGGFGGIGAIIAIQGAATTFASIVESAGTKFASGTAGALQGLAGGASAGFVGKELANAIPGLSKMSGTIGLAVGAFVGITGAVNGAVNAARKFEKELNNEKIKNATDTVSSALERLGKDAKDFGAIRDIESGIQRATEGILGNREVERTSPKAQFANFSDTIASFFVSEQQNVVAAQRALILETQGFAAYLRSADDSIRGELFDPIRQQQAEDDARSFKPIADAAIRLFEEQIKGGANIGEIINADEFKQFSDALARSNPIIAQRISAIKADTSINKEARQAKINDIVAQEAATQARVRTSALRAQLEIDAAQKTGKTLERVLNRIFENINQTLNAVTSGIKTVFDNIDIEIAAASGQSKIVFDDQKLITVLENQQAFSSNEVDAAINRFTPLLGDQGNTIGDIAKASSRLEGDVLAAINKAIKNPDNTTDESVATAVRKDIQGIVANLNLPPDVANILSRQISAGIDGLRSKGKDKIGLDTSDVRESIQGFGETIDSFKGANNVILNTAKTYNSALQRYTNVQNRLTESRVQRDQLLRNSIDILRSGAENLAKVFGRTASLSEVAAGVRDRTTRQTGGPDDPQEILRNVTRLQDRRRLLQSGRNSTSQDPSRFEQVQAFDSQLIDTNAALRNNIDALQAMASNTDVANAALSRIAQVQQQRQAQGGFLEKLVSSTPEEVNALNSAFGTIQRTLAGQDTTIQNSVNAQRAYIETLNETGNVFAAQQAAQGGLAEDRGAAIGLAKELAAFLPEGQGNEIRADLLQQFLRQTGNLTPKFQEVVNAIRNPEQDPESAEARNYYSQSIQQQSDASGALATIQANLEKQLQTGSATAVASAIAAIPLRVNVLNAGDIARGIQSSPPGRGQQNRAQGGIIYASEGQSISFQPKGTDTVPAMLTPGEFVVNRKAASRNMGMLQNINSGKTSYYQDGGVVGPYSSRQLKSEESMTANSFIDLGEWNKLVSPGNRKYKTARNLVHTVSSQAPLKIGMDDDDIGQKIRNAFFQGPSGTTVPGYSQPLVVNKNTDGGVKKRFEAGTDKGGMGMTVDDFRKSLSGGPSASGPYVSQSQIDDAVASSQQRQTLLATASQKTGLSLSIIEDLLQGKTSDLNIYHSKRQSGNLLAGVEGDIAAYDYDADSRDSNSFKIDQKKPQKISELRDYAKSFYGLTNHVRTSPANSSLNNIQKIDSVSRGIDAGRFSFNNPEKGNFGLFEEGNYTETKMSRGHGLGVARDDNGFTIGAGQSGFSVDEGSILTGGGNDLRTKIDLGQSQKIYDEVVNHRRLLQQKQRGAPTPGALAFIERLDGLASGRSVYKSLGQDKGFFQEPYSGMADLYGLSRRGKFIYDQNNDSDDFALRRNGSLVQLGLTDDDQTADKLKTEQEEVNRQIESKLRKTAAITQQFKVRVRNPLPIGQRDPRQPGIFELAMGANFDKYQAVFHNDTDGKFKANSIEAIQDRITGFKTPAIIPKVDKGNTLFRDESLSFLNGTGTQDGFGYSLRTYQNQIQRTIDNNLAQVHSLLGVGPQNNAAIRGTMGLSKAVGSAEKSGFFQYITGARAPVYDITKEVASAADRAKGDGREIDLPEVPSQDAGGVGILGKFNDMLKDSKSFWGRGSGILRYPEATDTNDALNKAADIASRFGNIPAGNNPRLAAWSSGFGKAFENIGGRLIDRYTSGGDVATVKLAHDLSMASGFDGSGALDQDGENYVKKIMDSGFQNFNGQPEDIPNNVQGVFSTLMNPQNIFKSSSIRGAGIVKMFRSFIDNEAYGDSPFGGLPSKNQASGASRILDEWYRGYQDKVVSPIREQADPELKSQLWQRAVRAYPGGNYRKTNFAHNLLGGSKFGSILNLGQIGQLSQAPIGLSNGGVVYASNGMQVPESLKQGTDTVPAMLTPGEFVVNAKAAKKHSGLLHQINGGGKPNVENGISYATDGGEIEAYVQQQFQYYATMLQRQWTMSQGLPANAPIPLMLRRQAKIQATIDGQGAMRRQAVESMMTQGYGYGVSKRPGDENRQSFLDKRKAMRNRELGLNDDGSRKKRDISRDQYIANIRRPQGEEETAQPGVIADATNPKPVTQSTSATSSKKPYTMPERGAGVSMVVGSVPAKEETPKPVTQSTSATSSTKPPVEEDPFGNKAFEKQKRERAETQAELAKIKSVDGKVRYVQAMWEKEGLTLSRERALAMLELQDTDTSSGREALLQRGQFDEGTPDPRIRTGDGLSNQPNPFANDIGPTEIEKSKPGISRFFENLENTKQVPLSGSNTTGSSSKTEFNGGRVVEDMLKDVLNTPEKIDATLRAIPFGDTLEDYLMSGGSAINSFLERSGAGYLGLGKELGGGKGFEDQQDYAARSAAIKEQITNLLLKRGSAEFYKDISFGMFDPMNSKSINTDLESRRNELTELEISQQQRLEKEGVSSIGTNLKSAGNIAGDLIPGFAGAPGAESVIGVGVRGMKSAGKALSSMPGHIQDFLKADAAQSTQAIAANQKATQRYLKYMESKGISRVEAMDSLRASQMTNSPEFIKNSLSRDAKTQELKGFLGEGVPQGMTAAQTAKIPPSKPKEVANLADAVEIKKVQPKPKVSTAKEAFGKPNKSEPIDLNDGISTQEIDQLAKDHIKTIQSNRTSVKSDVPKNTGNPRNSINRDAKELTSFGEQTAQAAAPTLSYKKKYEQFLKRTGQKPSISDPKQMKIFMDAMERKSKLPEVEEGFTRLYRYGETVDNFKKPYGADKPAHMQSHPEFKLKKDSAGRFFTDKPEQLDFYVRETNNSGFTDQPFKYTDIPTDKLDKFSVAPGRGKQKFGDLSQNKNAEFVLSDAEVRKALTFNRGGSVLVDYAPQGTDTVPAMLTPGEFVVNREATQKNLGLLKAMNKSRGGKVNNGVLYAENGLDAPVGLSSFTMPSSSVGSGSSGGVDLSGPVSAFSSAVSTFQLAVGSFAAAGSFAPVAATPAAPIDFSSLASFNTRFEAGINSLGSIDFSVIRVGANIFGSSVSALNVPVTNFSQSVTAFANLLNQTNSLVNAITAIGNINGRIEVQGSIQMPTEITVNIEGLEAGAGGSVNAENLTSSIMNSVADALSTQMPGIDVDGLRNQVNGTGEQTA